MNKPLLILSLAALLTFLCPPLGGQIATFGSPRDQPPKGWQDFAWPEKKKVLLGHFAPTPEEKDLIHDAAPSTLRAPAQKDRRILLFYRCGYAHASIAAGIEAFQQISKKTGAYRLDLSDDPAVFTAENLAQYDALLLLNSVAFDRFLSDDQKTSLLSFVEGGKGLVGIHAASDACKNWKAGARLMGGVFRCHPWSSTGTWATRLESPEHSLNHAWGGQAPYVRDEIYLFNDGTVSRERSRILMALDMSQDRNLYGKGFAERERRRVREDGDYPIAWIHQHGKGRVFYSNLGHNSFTFWNPAVLRHFLDGIQYALGDLQADATPSARLKPEDLKTASVSSQRVIFLAGGPSHQTGAHEFRAGSLLLAKRLNAQVDLPIQAEVILGWPEDDSVLDGAAAIVLYCDSDSVHHRHYPRLMELNGKGTGLFFMHYGVHPGNPQNGKDYYLPSVGGFMETGFSVNPHWVADITVASHHPVRRGLEKPFKVFDELYYHMRFDPKAQPIATAIPTKDNLIPNNLWNENGPAGFGKPQTLLWGFTRPDGTRGAAFTGGHWHRNWAHDAFRKLVLNSIVWTAGLEVPPKGIQAPRVSEKEINANLDHKPGTPPVRIKLPLKKPMDYRQDLINKRSGR